MPHKRLPLLAVGDVITELDLNSAQIRHATTAMEQIVRTAYRRRRGRKLRLHYEEFADQVPECHWVLLFEACALIHLGRHRQASTLLTAQRHIEAARHRTPSATFSKDN
ncbi:hypothetical protein OG897_35490 [Streptomyces sp. NBC_00237]|uniref:hypothetical protein n=1 Tax=Streptomyces sp. NBC_00237 TaxID=2975687 RepID=UPI0022590F35|nr:hypothetical protein [Streptomyces sp. NBC_00237]MCX5206695.1 hypothetical protein [Streptomyces sp. NBC_00237]